MHDILISGIGSELQGVGRLPDGRAVFVPGAIPGERVRIRVDMEKGRFCEASLIEVLAPSPDRTIPDCPHAGLCGGCQARHMTYESSLRFKRQKVTDALTRIGGLVAPNVLETLGCQNPNRTRNKAEYPLARRNGRIAIGAIAGDGRTVIPLRDCLSQDVQSIRALNWLSDQLDSLPAAGRLKYLVTRVNRVGEMVIVLSGDAPIASELKSLSPAPEGTLSLWYCQLNRRAMHALDGRCTRLWGPPTLRERLFDLEFELSPQSFFQVNASQTEVLYSKALEAAGVVPGCDLTVLDAYCGAGTITLSAARWCKRATGIEIVAPAIENARQNARSNALHNVDFICGDASKEIPQLLQQGRRFDAAILDPPRKGAEGSLLDAIADARIPAVSYVSCNPATLARDMNKLHARGYRLQWAQPVDMFPWTGHVETVCLMSRVEGK